MEKIMRFVISTVDDATIERVAAIIRNPEETSELIMIDAFRNGYIVAVIIICFFISLISFITCVLAAGTHAFAGGKKLPSTGTITAALMSFVCCIILACIGTYLFSSSIEHMKHGLDSLPSQLDKSSSDISTFVEEFGENLRCNFYQGEKALVFNLNSFTVNISAVLSNIKERINPEGIAKISPTMEKFRDQLHAAITQFTSSASEQPPAQDIIISSSRSLIAFLSNGVRPMIAKLHEIRQSLISIRREIDTSISQMSSQKKAMSSELGVYRRVLGQVVSGVDLQLQEFQSILFDVLRENDIAQKASEYLPLTLFLPITLFGLSAIGLAFLLLRCVCNIGNQEANEEFPIRNALSDAGARILSFGGYLALLVTSVLFLMLALCFTIAFISMFLCMGLFEDHDLRLLHALPSREVRVKLDKHEIRFTLYEIFYKCKNGFSFFDAIDGDKIWAREEIGKKLSSLRITQFRRSMRNIYVSPEVIIALSNTIVNVTAESKKMESEFQTLSPTHDPKYHEIAQTVSRMLNDSGELVQFLTGTEDLVTYVSSRSNRDKFSKDIQSQLEQAEMTIISGVAKLLRVISDLSPQCESLMSIWNDIGFYLCNIIAEPAQGLWMACLVSAIGSLFIYYALFNATTFLFNYEEEKAASLSLRTASTPPKPKTKTPPQIGSTAPSPSTIRSPDTRVEWIPVDEVKQQLFNIPPGVNFMPVLLPADQERSIREGERLASLRSRLPLQRAVWVPSRGSFTQGSWQRLNDEKAELLSSLIATALDISPTKSKKDKVKVPHTLAKDGRDPDAKKMPEFSSEAKSPLDSEAVQVEPYMMPKKEAHGGAHPSQPPESQPSSIDYSLRDRVSRDTTSGRTPDSQGSSASLQKRDGAQMEEQTQLATRKLKGMAPQKEAGPEKGSFDQEHSGDNKGRKPGVERPSPLAVKGAELQEKAPVPSKVPGEKSVKEAVRKSEPSASPK